MFSAKISNFFLKKVWHKPKPNYYQFFSFQIELSFPRSIFPSISFLLQVAIKILSNVQRDSEMDREAALLARLDHPNVLRIFGMAPNCAGQLALVLELMNQGDLR